MVCGGICAAGPGGVGVWMILERLFRDMTQDAYYGVFQSVADGTVQEIRLTEKEARAYQKKIGPGERHQEPRRDGFRFVMMLGVPLYTNGQTMQNLRPGQLAPIGAEGYFRVIVPDSLDAAKALTWFDLRPNEIIQDAQQRVTLVADGGRMVNLHGNKEYTFTLVNNTLELVNERPR